MWRASGISGAELEEHRREIDAAYAAKITTGEPYYAYVAYPYIEWYSDNGRVVLGLDPSQVSVVDANGMTPKGEKTAAELVADRKKRAQAFGTFMSEMTRNLSEANRRQGGDGNVLGFRGRMIPRTGARAPAGGQINILVTFQEIPMGSCAWNCSVGSLVRTPVLVSSIRIRRMAGMGSVPIHARCADVQP